MNPDYVPLCSYSNWGNVSVRLSPGRISLIAINARGLTSKFSELSAYLSGLNSKPSFVVITETWLSRDRDCVFELDGYRSHSIYREKQLGGGIKLYYLGTLSVSIVDEFTGIFDCCENLTIGAYIRGYGKLIISCFYRPPNRPLTPFFEYLQNIFDFLCENKSIIVGDFNIDISSFSSTVSQYIDISTSYGFVNEVNINTYVSPITYQDKSILDHVWHNLKLKCETLIVRPALSDHYSICSIFDIQMGNERRKVRFRDFSDDNIDSFSSGVAVEFGRFGMPLADAHSHAAHLVSFLGRLLNKYFPVKVREVSEKRIRAPWINKSILKCIHKKHDWYRLMKLGRISIYSYKRYCYALRDLLRMAEQDYYRCRLGSLSDDQRANWKIINNLMGKKTSSISDYFIVGNEEIHDPLTIANNFNQYFIEHPKRLQDSLCQSTDDYSNIISVERGRMFFDLCTVSEVHKVIVSSVNKGNLNDIPVKFLKICGEHLASALTDLFNQCFRESIYPDCFKTSRVTPVFKKGPRTQLDNHRPISVLCNLGKVFDSIIHERITRYFVNSGILSPNQYGFRKEKNTEIACIHLVDKILPAFAEGSYCICIFLDFSACFDTIDRSILFGKMEKYGVRDNSLQFVKSYFSNRKQYVVYSGVESDILHQDIGTIQGSRNGPRFFDIYSNDINILLGDDQNVLYADDTTIAYVHKDLDVLTNYVNGKLSQLLDWCRFNKMVINPAKSQYILLTNKRVPVNPTIKIGEDIIERVNSCKYLGVYLDDNLQYHDQINHIKSKLRQMRGISYRLGKYLDKKSARKIYYSMVYSTVAYCITVWGGVFCCTQRGEELQALQAAIVKNLFDEFRKDNECNFKANSILKLTDIYRLRVCVYMFKILKLGLYPSLLNDLNIGTSDHMYNTRNRSNLMQPFPRVENVRMNYQYMFPDIWNKLPTYLKELETVSSFKKRLINHFLIQY